MPGQSSCAKAANLRLNRFIPDWIKNIMSNSYGVLINHARILLPNGDFLLGDVVILDGKILEVAPEIDHQTFGVDTTTAI